MKSNSKCNNKNLKIKIQMKHLLINNSLSNNNTKKKNQCNHSIIRINFSLNKDLKITIHKTSRNKDSNTCDKTRTQEQANIIPKIKNKDFGKNSLNNQNLVTNFKINLINSSNNFFQINKNLTPSIHKVLAM